MSNDTWSSYPFVERPWWNKIHCIPHKTIDSLPFLEDQIKHIKISKTFFVWSDFAEKEAIRLGLNNVKTIPGICKSAIIFKLNKLKKQELRQKFNISQNAFITGFVFRNQLRKLPKVLMEGLLQL